MNSLKLPEGYLCFNKHDPRLQALKLKSIGYGIAAPNEIMKMVVNYGGDFENVQSKSFGSSYGVAFNSKGDTKIIRNPNKIVGLDFNSDFSRDGVSLINEEFEEFSGKDVLFLSYKKVKELEDKIFNSPSKIINQEVWNFLSESKTSLLEDYSKFVFEGVKKKWQRDFAMSINLDSKNYFFDCSKNIIPLSFNGLGIGAGINISLMGGLKFLGVNRFGAKIPDLEKIALSEFFIEKGNKGEPFFYNGNVFLAVNADKIFVKNK